MHLAQLKRLFSRRSHSVAVQDNLLVRAGRGASIDVFREFAKQRLYTDLGPYLPLTPLGANASPTLCGRGDDFIASAGAGLPSPWAGTMVKTGGTPTIAYMNDNPGGIVALTLDVTNEIETARIDFLDNLQIPVVPGLVVTFVGGVVADSTGESGQMGTGDKGLVGLASAYNANPDLITTSIWVMMKGDAGANHVYLEWDANVAGQTQDDVDTEIAYNMTGVMGPMTFDFTDLEDVKIIVGGIDAGKAAGVTINMANARGTLLQPYCWISKAAATNNNHIMVFDYIEYFWPRAIGQQY